MKDNEMRVTPYKIDYSVETDNGKMDRLFVNTRTGKVVWAGEFPEWDH